MQVIIFGSGLAVETFLLIAAGKMFAGNATAPKSRVRLWGGYLQYLDKLARSRDTGDKIRLFQMGMVSTLIFFGYIFTIFAAFQSVFLVFA